MEGEGYPPAGPPPRLSSVTLATGPAILVDAGAWAAIQVSCGYLTHRLPESFLERDGWLFRERDWEREGVLYVRVFRVRRWKRLLPEAGDIFKGGFDKRRLTRRDRCYLMAYRRETRRAELGHWLASVPFPLFFLWNRWSLGGCMAAYAVGVNAPCIIAQRFNRIRLQRVLTGGRTGRGQRRPPGP